MRPIAELDLDEARGLRGVLFDLDDTFLDHGRIDEHAFSILYRLQEAGLSAFAVTGRPAGWGELCARQWPIAGAVSENGAIAFHREGRGVRRLDSASESERRARRQRLAVLVADLLEAFPELSPADDVDTRISDFTFDIGEHRRVSPEVVTRAMAFLRARGARTTRSSVHLHATFDGADKASGSLMLIRIVDGVDATVARRCYAFIGDSENDAACFSALHTTIGVANLRGMLTIPPRFVTQGASAAGFVEAMTALLTKRGG